MDYAITIDNQTGLAAMSFEKSSSLMNKVYFSLEIRRGSFFAITRFGSRLYLLERAKNTDTTMRLAMDYCREAIQWLLDSGEASAHNVYAERDRTQNLNRLKLLNEVIPANGGDPVTFTKFIEVV